MENKCKRHKWMLGAKTDVILIKNKYVDMIPTKQIAWCERCGKKIKINIYSDFELEKLKESYKN